VHQIGPVLIKLPLHLIDDAGEFSALLDKTGERMGISIGNT